MLRVYINIFYFSFEYPHIFCLKLCSYFWRRENVERVIIFSPKVFPKKRISKKEIIAYIFKIVFCISLFQNFLILLQKSRSILKKDFFLLLFFSFSSLGFLFLETMNFEHHRYQKIYKLWIKFKTPLICPFRYS